jgi:hypothetical protein
MEMATPENEALVSEVYSRLLLGRAEGKALNAAEQMLYEVEMLTQEVNSGASFEQYFRWSSLAEIRAAAGRLEELGQAEAARLTREAVAVAFPGGLPASDAGLEELTDWSGDQEERLGELAEAYTGFNGAITNALADWYRRASGT